MLKIRLMRIGTKKKPFYRVVAVDERAKRTGAYIELLGTYNPLTEPKEIKLIQDRIDYWVKQGAVKSTGFLRIIGQAPQRLPRKPKKPARNVSHSDASGQSDAGGEKKAEPSAQPEEKVADTAETPTTQTPTESASQQAGTEAQSETSQPQTSEPATKEEPAVEESEKKDERPS
ncbi:MAG: ribosomal protein S16 [uncultured bacterium]|nr:MAG: ribosomal protein S16 [uncultured bacterium]HCE31075.1 30S ribosomal protein S16 [Candidatus Daviesbacteria bacterium]